MGVDELSTITIVTPKWLDEMKESYKDDLHTQQVPRGVNHNMNYTFTSGILKNKNRVYTGRNQEMRKIIENIHNDPVTGHFGILVTHKWVTSLFFWKGVI